MIEKKLRDKIEQLIARANDLENVAESRRNDHWTASVDAWTTSVVNVIRLAVPDMFQPYRQAIESPVLRLQTTSQRLLIIRSTLQLLLADVEKGLVGTIANKIRAETFDDFLDLAVAYQGRGAKENAGVIAGVVFEDTMRKIYADKIDKVTRPDLEQVIIALTKKEVITEEQAKQARVAQLVRNKAAHADWDGFTMEGVNDTIKITKALIEAHLK